MPAPSVSAAVGPAPVLSACEIPPELTLKGEFASGRDILITGTFEGRLRAAGSVTICATGSLSGAIEASGLVLVPGYRLVAELKIGPTSIPNAAAPEKKRFLPAMKKSPLRGGIRKLRDLVLGRTS